MTFLTSIALVAAALVLAVLGVLEQSTALFVMSAICSGAAVVLVWRRVAAGKEKLDFPEAPDRSDPNWTQELRDRRVTEPEDPEGLVDERLLGIARFDELLAAEVLPKLETLSIEELRAVIRHEKNGLAREAIIRRAERLIELTLGGGVDIRPEPVIHGRPDRNDELVQRPARRPGPDLSL